jgi:putative inorganic carbon (hco3(-)) transporter
MNRILADKSFLKFSIVSFLGLLIMFYAYFSGNTHYIFLGFVLVLPLLFFLFLYRFKWLYYLMILSLPLSIHLDDIGMGIGISLPGEFLLILVFIGVIWRVIFRFEAYRLILFHPISLILLVHLFWILFTSITSVLPTVSVKFLLLQFLYITVFYLYGCRLFLESGRLKTMIRVYIIGFIPVIFYSVMNYVLLNNGSYEFANRTCYPFFNDHTIYATSLTLIMPLTFMFVLRKANRTEFLVYLIILVFGWYYAFSRAGLLALVACVFFALFLILNKRLKWLAFSGFIALAIGFFVLKFAYSASEHPDSKLAKFIYSIVDSKNHSNNERLNRWNSAIEMFKEKPVVGFGPGTYQFVYAHYQSNQTEISVSDGSMGGAHSEYLKPLSEQGFLGLFIVLLLIFRVFKTGNNLLKNISDYEKWIIVACLAGVFAYLIHGLFNFYLDTDKAAVLYWGLIAYLVALELRWESGKSSPTSSTKNQNTTAE